MQLLNHVKLGVPCAFLFLIHYAYTRNYFPLKLCFHLVRCPHCYKRNHPPIRTVEALKERLRVEIKRTYVLQPNHINLACSFTVALFFNRIKFITNTPHYSKRPFFFLGKALLINWQSGKSYFFKTTIISCYCLASYSISGKNATIFNVEKDLNFSYEIYLIR